MKIPRTISLRHIWTKIPMPDQVKRLILIAAVIITGYFIIRQNLIPDTYNGREGYQAAVAESAASLPISYIGENVCRDCHYEIGQMKSGSYHKGVTCEVCHGPGAEHVEIDPETVKLSRPTDRGFCALCHGYNATKPTGFPQIDLALHNPVEPCMACHDPHDPTPPHVPQECRACHGEIARTKAISPHTSIDCTRCHETPEEHKINPRSATPNKPQTRDFCGSCHSYGADSPAGIPRIDLESHETGYLCWQCHYPHHPEK